MSKGHWRTIKTNANAAGQRVDTWLAGRFGNWSRSAVARLIADGLIKSDTRILKRSSTLVPDEYIQVFMFDESPDGPAPPMPPVLHEDDRVLVLDKPAGMLCHPAGRLWVYCVIGRARVARPDDRIDLVHRIDRETSGVLVLTKDQEANAFLKERFRTGEGVDKEYRAIVRGVVPWQRQVVKAPIGQATDSEIRIRRGINHAGRDAHTDFEVIQRMAAHTLVDCRLHTGRTHQIRVHLEHVGFPLLGDKLYGQPDRVFLHKLDHGEDAAVRKATGFPRHCLHAARVVLPHPEGHELVVEAPMPPDMDAIIQGQQACWPADSK